MPFRFLTCLLVVVASLSAQSPRPPATSAMSDAEIEKAVEALLSKMTLAEKLGQMSQSNYSNRPKDLTPLLKEASAGKIGSVLNAYDVETINALQKAAVEESRLKIPLLMGIDVIHGYRTLFPIPVAQSCSWNPDLVERAARVAAIEASQDGIRWTFAPMIDLTHEPRWGRIAETCGEDPYLTSLYAAAMVRGFQGQKLDDPQSIAACAKHYVGYGAAEGGRDYNSTLIPENELYNHYLPPFKAAVDAGVLTFMSAFNDLNGVPTSGNAWTLRKILKGEWGFKGLVVSDWESVYEMIEHGYAANKKQAGQRGIAGGVDLEMVSTSFREYGEALLKEGKIDQPMIDDAVRRILRVKYKLGLFARPYTDPKRPNTHLSDEHLSVARELAAQSMVLLKNNHQTLPLAPAGGQTIAVIGPLANSGADMRGCWYSRSEPDDCVTVYAALRKEAAATGQFRVLFSPGLDRARSTDTRSIAAAVEVAKQADVIVLCVGEDHDLAGEARSRAFLDLPGAQSQLIEAIANTGRPVVLVVFSGRPLTFARDAAHAQAVLFAWHPGTVAGLAVADLLFGRVNPSAKLTTSFPRTVGQIPYYYNHRNTGRPSRDEDVGVTIGTPQEPRGYFSRYIDVHSSPQYEFGYGLSYSKFKYSNLRIEGPGKGNSITASVTVENASDREGVEVVQLYTRTLAASITRPVKELRDFQRLAFKAREKKTVTFTLPLQKLAFFNQELKPTVENGTYHLFIGASSQNNLQGEFVVGPVEPEPAAKAP